MNEQRYRVTRFCCRSGLCIDCRAAINGTKRKRIVQGTNLTLDRAKQYVDGWRDYEPKMEIEQ